MEQNYEITDLEPAGEGEPLYLKCNRCGRNLDVIGNNVLGQDPNTCKHWCDKCFEKIKEWIRDKKEIKVKGRVKEILEVREKYKTTYSIHFMKFILQTKNEELVVKIFSYVPRIKIKDNVIVEGKLFDRDFYNNDDRKLIRATKVEKVNAQLKIKQFLKD